MKKLLGTTLAVAMILPAGASAELLKNFKMGGSLDVDAVSANNVKDFNTATYDHVGTAQSRVMLHLDWDLLDDVHSHVSLTKNDRTYGTGAKNLDSIQTNTLVDEASVKLDKLFGSLDLTLGRQFYGEAGDLVIYVGPTMGHVYGLPVAGVDAARFDWNGEKLGLTALIAKTTGKVLAGIDTADVNVQGLDLRAKPMGDVTTGAYLYRKETVNSATAGQNVRKSDVLYVAGLKAKAMVMGLSLKGEGAVNFGKNEPTGITGGSNYKAWAYKGSADYKLDMSKIGAVTAWGELAEGSGGAANHTFTAISGDYRPGSIYGRFGTGASMTLNTSGTAGSIGTNTLANRVILGAGAKVTPTSWSKLTAGLSWWNIRAQTANNLPAAAKGNKFIGNEYDLDLSWAHSENVSVSAGVGSFQPGGLVTTQQGVNSPARLAYTDFSFKF